MAGAFGLFQPTPFYNSMKNKVPDVSESNCKYGKHRLAPVLLLCCQFSTMRMHLLDKLLGQGFGGASPNQQQQVLQDGRTSSALTLPQDLQQEHIPWEI